jgi:hypothetical protein
MGTIVDWEGSVANMEHETWDMMDGNSEGGKLEAGDVVIGKQNERTMTAEACGLRSHAL